MPTEPRASGDWPWWPGTQNQGFLVNRWNRFDGTGYLPLAGQARNSPIAGGLDALLARKDRGEKPLMLSD